MLNKDFQEKKVGKDLSNEVVSKEKDLQNDEVKKDLITMERSNHQFNL